MLSYLPIHLHTRLRSTPLGARSFYCHISLVLDSAVRGAFKSRHGAGAVLGWLASSPSQGQAQAAQLQICYVCSVLWCPSPEPKYSRQCKHLCK